MTVQRKTLGKGTIVKVNGTERGRIISFDLPAQEYAQIEAPELNPQDDSGTTLPFDPVELGDEVKSEFKWMEYWDPRHADGTGLETLYAAKAAVAFALLTPHTTNDATLSFSGKITKLGPQQLTKTNYYQREVTCIRTTAITNIATP